MSNVMDYYYLYPPIAEGELFIEYVKSKEISEEYYFNLFYTRTRDILEGQEFEFLLKYADAYLLDHIDVFPAPLGFLVSNRLFDAVSALIESEVIARAAVITTEDTKNNGYTLFRTRRDLAILDADPDQFHTWINAKIRIEHSEKFNVGTDKVTREFIFAQPVIDIIERHGFHCSWKKIRAA